MRSMFITRWAALLATLTLAACVQFTRNDANEELIRAHPERFVVITLQNTEAMPSPRAGSSPRDYGSPTQYGVAPRTRSMARDLAAQYKLKPVREWPITQLRVHCIVYEMSVGESQSDLLRRLRTDSRVESAQPLHAFDTLSGSYNDPYAGLQRNLATMGVPQAHAWSRGKGVSIAVIDTAIDSANTQRHTGQPSPASSQRLAAIKSASWGLRLRHRCMHSPPAGRTQRIRRERSVTASPWRWPWRMPSS
jgi:hypothetical protein